ncbi:MAG: GNAT family N-acetyltransferase [Rhizobium sp.]|nr:GNAT family N-acetyltransferase [Rhizobium sp.]
MSRPLVIRDATAADEAAWRGLWNQYLTFYKVDLADDVTAHTWARILDPSSRVAMRVAEVDGLLAGFAIHHDHDSTWVKTPDCYLEDLFLDAAYRGKGIGRALIDDLIAIAKAKGWSRLYWHTDRDNLTARKLYDTYAPEDGHVRYRLKLR